MLRIRIDQNITRSIFWIIGSNHFHSLCEEESLRKSNIVYNKLGNYQFHNFPLKGKPTKGGSYGEDHHLTYIEYFWNGEG